MEVRVELPPKIFPDRPVTIIPVPRARNLEDLVVQLRECRCGCRHIFIPGVAWQFFYDDNHRRRHESKHRRPWRKDSPKPQPETRLCRCGCGSTFTALVNANQVYLDRTHRDRARELRRKFARAGVAV